MKPFRLLFFQSCFICWFFGFIAAFRLTDPLSKNLWEPLALEPLSHSVSRIQTLVYRGDKAPKPLPFLAALVFVGNGGKGNIMCGSTVIDDYHLLTAAHCLQGATSGLEAWIGPIDLDNFNGTRIRVARAAVHPRYNGPSDQYWHDIGIVELENPVKGVGVGGPGDGQAICLGTGNFNGARVTLGGFGTYDGFRTSRSLLTATGTALGVQECLTYNHPGTLIDSQICARIGNANGEAAEEGNGDSGGPLFTKPGSRHVQVGIVSYLYKNQNGLPNTNVPGTYTRVGAPVFTNFIKTHAPETQFCNEYGQLVNV